MTDVTYTVLCVYPLLRWRWGRGIAGRGGRWMVRHTPHWFAALLLVVR